MKYFFIILILSSQYIHAKIDYNKSILFIVGYMDEQPSFSEVLRQPSQLFYRKYYNDLGKLINNEISTFLEFNSFKKLNSNQFVNEDNITVKILNVNIECPDEINQDISKRTTVCYQQIDKSKQSLDYLNSAYLKSNDVIIYLGHSRKGMGMAIGPFTPEYTFPLVVYNDYEKGNLKKIIYASCSSQKYYQNKYHDMGLNFVGTTKDMLIFNELLPWALNQLKNELKIINKQIN